MVGKEVRYNPHAFLTSALDGFPAPAALTSGNGSCFAGIQTMEKSLARDGNRTTNQRSPSPYLYVSTYNFTLDRQ